MISSDIFTVREGIDKWHIDPIIFRRLTMNSTINSGVFKWGNMLDQEQLGKKIDKDILNFLLPSNTILEYKRLPKNKYIVTKIS